MPTWWDGLTGSDYDDETLLLTPTNAQEAPR
jgi:hypothetical protein